MARGPSPTPTAILEARGSRRAIGRNGEPQLPVERPDPPAWLAGESRAEWDRQVAQLELAGVLALMDRPLLALFCEAWGEFVEAVQLIRQEGLFVTTTNKNKIQHPAVAIRNRAAERMLAAASRLGFSPADRTRLRVSDAAAAGKSTLGVCSRQR